MGCREIMHIQAKTFSRIKVLISSFIGIVFLTLISITFTSLVISLFSPYDIPYFMSLMIYVCYLYLILFACQFLGKTFNKNNDCQ